MLDANELSILDAFAQRLIRADERVRYTIAQTPTEIEQVLRLRYLTVIERGWAKPEDFPDGLERDEYDEDAIHLVGWQDAKLAATMRLVLPSPTRPLPTEAAFGIRIEPYQQITDCSRGIVVPAFRDRSQQLFFGILGRFWQEIRQHGYQDFCATYSKLMIRWLRTLKNGLTIQILGEAQDYWGEKRYPIKFDTPETVKRLRGAGTPQ
jgi:N-acyl-L-homoserine lactone synthetase